MLGAIAGDIIGSIRENVRTKRKDFRLFTPFVFFTDDTVLTIAIADAILNGSEYGPVIKTYARRYPFRGYGPRFYRWMFSRSLEPYFSFGNGSAMRVSAIAYAFDTEADVLAEARRSSECTHNHPEGIKGAQAVALAVFYARSGWSKDEIRASISERFSYDLARSVDAIRPRYRINLTCQGSVPEAIIAFLDSSSFEDAIRNAVSLGGDADTQAAIAGAIAEAYYGSVPDQIVEQVVRRLNTPLLGTLLSFYKRYELNTQLAQLEKFIPSAFAR